MSKIKLCFRIAHPNSENRIDLITDTPTELITKQRCAEITKTKLSVLMDPKDVHPSGNASETTSLVIKGDLFSEDTKGRIGHEKNSE